MSRADREPRPLPIIVEDVRVGDVIIHAGVQVEVHRVQERPGVGVALVVHDPTRPAWTGRRLFYKLGEHVEVLL